MAVAQKHAEITTEGIKYAGSKLKLLPHILRLAEKVQAMIGLAAAA